MDIALFRFINTKLANPLFDTLMPFVSGNPVFFPALFVAALVLIWKGRTRGILCVAMLAIILPLGDRWVCRTIKKAVERPRPFVVLADVHRPGSDNQYSRKSIPELISTNSTETLNSRETSLPSKSPTDPRTAPIEPRPELRSPTRPWPPGVPTGSMPSSHAANWFAAAMVAYVYYRRSRWIMLPAALLVSFSRIYNGVHYPSDVLVGAILGAGYAAAGVWTLEHSWQWAGKKWFPLWWEKLPSLIYGRIPSLEAGDDVPAAGFAECQPERSHPLERFARGDAVQPRSPHLAQVTEPARPWQSGHLPISAPRVRQFSSPHLEADSHWRRLGYLVISALLLARLLYIAGDTLELTGDEAYQWLWSKHLALSFHSKPPLMACAQFVSTALFGDTAFGVRFFSPICSAILSLGLLAFFSREFNARAGFLLLLTVTAVPLASACAVLMTVDPFSILFWGTAMIAGWRAIQPDSSIASWAWVGVWIGLGFLASYAGLFQWLCWAVFFLLWPPARQQLRRSGPYLALLISFLFAIPVVIWSTQRGWSSISHIVAGAKAGQGPAPFEFLGTEALLLNPVFFVGMIWAAIAFWRRHRRDPRLVFLFSMGAPFFLVFFLYSVHSRVQRNWVAPSIIPLFCLMVTYWDTRLRLGSQVVKGALIVGLALGLPLVIVGHDTELIAKLTGHRLPVDRDPFLHARGWKEAARLVEDSRQKVLAEGKPVFVIADDQRLAAELSFYMTEARLAKRERPLVYCPSNPGPMDQFYFWPGYFSGGRQGENALLVMELRGDDPLPKSAPLPLLEEFESVHNLGVRAVMDRGRLLRHLQLFACRGLK